METVPTAVWVLVAVVVLALGVVLVDFARSALVAAAATGGLLALGIHRFGLREL